MGRLSEKYLETKLNKQYVPHNYDIILSSTLLYLIKFNALIVLFVMGV